MNELVKTYDVASGELKFIFRWSPLLAQITDFEVLNISPLRYGYDTADSKDVAVYPANITLEIDDYEGDNYAALRKLYSHYSITYPFNHYQVFYMQLILNGAVIFSGILEGIDKEIGERTMSVTLVDGVNKFKDVKVSNPYLLESLYTNGLIPRIPFLGNYAHVYGFGSISYATTSQPGQSVKTPGYLPGNIVNGDRDTPLAYCIRSLILSLRSDLQIEFNNTFKYGEANAPLNELLGIDAVNIRRVMSNLLGRYVVIRKITGRYNQIGELESAEEYQKADKFELVYEDDTYLVYFHNWSGVFPNVINAKKWEKGVEDKSLSALLKVLAQNTYSYYGLKGPGQFFFRHKNRRSDSVTLDYVKNISKTFSYDPVTELIVSDYYTDNSARRGSNYGDDREKLELKIPLNAFNTANGTEYRLNYYVNGVEKRVVHFYDSESNRRDIPQELIASLEWEAHRTYTDQYELILPGVNYSMSGSYSFSYANYSGTIRPVTIEIDLMNDETRMTGVQI